MFLFEDVSDDPTTFGSDDFFEFSQQLNLKIFGPLNYGGDWSDLKIRIIRALKEIGFLFDSNPGGVSALPDTDKRSMRLIFNRITTV